jgi:cytochrome c oxidase assembly protein subunit 15
VISLDIAFGALTEALDAGVLWRSFPFYADALLPGPDRLFAFAPAWHNFFENGYLIQACHRVLSFILWAAALIALLAAWSGGRPWRRSAVLLALLTVTGALGAATVMLGEPVALSVVHQVVAVLVLAVALIPAAPRIPRAPQIRAA